MGRTHVTAARERYYGADGPPGHGDPPGDRPGLDVLSEQACPASRVRRTSPNYVTDSASSATAWASV